MGSSMNTIKSFIDLGWHTVPLKGKLERLPNGDKTLPAFEKGWKARYSQEFNTVQAKLGGTITGKKSNIIAIDCDNDVTYEMFRSMDPEYTFIFKSKGKLDTSGQLKVCGTFIYTYDDELIDSFSINDGVLAIDCYSEGGFVYLPTDANATKEPWHGKLPELRAMPYSSKVLLQRLKDSNNKQAVVATYNKNIFTASCLQPLVKQFTEKREFMPGLFKIITPKCFRDEPQYVKYGYLHPSNIPEGRGSEYMVKISAILGADISIDVELYCAAMHDINSLWQVPMDLDRLDATIINPMINGQSSINGVPIWTFDETWATHRLILRTKRQASVELCFDDKRDMYYCVDPANESIRGFNRDTDMMSYLGSIAFNVPSKPEVKHAIPIVNVTAVPTKSFGFHESDDPTARELNTFIRTPELAILADPEPYAKFYKRPDTILRYLDTLVPEEAMRQYLVKFLKRKLTKFEYSPVVLFFLGVHGSGKDTLVSIIEHIIGKVARPTTREFLEMFNGWILDTYFAQLDEYGNQLSVHKDKEEALGKLKAYTGKPSVQIRQMRTDGFDYQHSVTFIMTQNKNPLMFEDGDRRIAFFPTPNVLVEADWIEDMATTYEKIMAEIKDFCYYLATEVPMLSYSEFLKPPESIDKRRLIADSMYAASRIAYACKHEMLDYIKNLGHDYNCTKFLEALNKGRIYYEDMESLYDAMTDMKGDFRALNKELKNAGIAVRGTSIAGGKAYYYDLEWLAGPFEADVADANNDNFLGV